MTDRKSLEFLHRKKTNTGLRPQIYIMYFMARKKMAKRKRGTEQKFCYRTERTIGDGKSEGIRKDGKYDCRNRNVNT